MGLEILYANLYLTVSAKNLIQNLLLAWEL